MKVYREIFLREIEKYGILSDECKQDFSQIISIRTLKKNEYLLEVGVTPSFYAFVLKGLFSYYYITENGDRVIKIFFSENSLLTSCSALIQKKTGIFFIEALEDSEVLVFNNEDFRLLIKKYPELALCYINYMEVNWVVAKEHREIEIKYERAKERYIKFLEEYKSIEPRLKKHHIASYLGITPTQLSRIRNELNFF